MNNSTLLHRIIPDLNEARFYYVMVGPSLVDKWAVIRVWGRIGGWQRQHITPCESLAAAERLAAKLVQQRLKRGYQLVTTQFKKAN